MVRGGEGRAVADGSVFNRLRGSSGLEERGGLRSCCSSCCLCCVLLRRSQPRRRAGAAQRLAQPGTRARPRNGVGRASAGRAPAVGTAAVRAGAGARASQHAQHVRRDAGAVQHPLPAQALDVVGGLAQAAGGACGAGAGGAQAAGHAAGVGVPAERLCRQGGCGWAGNGGRAGERRCGGSAACATARSAGKPASRAAIPAAQARSQPRPCTRAHPAARP